MKKQSRGHKEKSNALYETSIIKRNRRTSADIKNVLDWVQYILGEEEGQITIRHLYYRLVGHEIIEKTEGAYKGLCSHLSKWRRSGAVEWSAFADSTRWHIKEATFDSVDDALKNTVETYRRNLWATQKVYVEVWCEKDAVAGILAKAAEPFGVPIFVARGFASLSSLYNAANTFKEWSEAGKQCIIYHFGDYDPSGVAAGESMVKAFRDDFKVDVKFIRAAVTEKQIRDLKLPTRPVKISDTRTAKWKGGDSVELDTMPPAEMRKLVEDNITRHIDQHQWEMLKETESFERITLKLMREGYFK